MQLDSTYVRVNYRVQDQHQVKKTEGEWCTEANYIKGTYAWVMVAFGFHCLLKCVKHLWKGLHIKTSINCNLVMQLYYVTVIRSSELIAIYYTIIML